MHLQAQARIARHVAAAQDEPVAAIERHRRRHGQGDARIGAAPAMQQIFDGAQCLVRRRGLVAFGMGAQRWRERFEKPWNGGVDIAVAHHGRQQRPHAGFRVAARGGVEAINRR